MPDWPRNDIHIDEQRPYVDQAFHRVSGDPRFMQARRPQHGPYSSPHEDLRDSPRAEEYVHMDPRFTRRQRQGSGMQNRQPDAHSVPYPANPYEEDRRAQRPHQPNAQRRRSGRRNPGFPDMEGSLLSIDGRSGTSASRSGQGRPFHEPGPEAGGSEEIRGPRQRHREGGGSA